MRDTSDLCRVRVSNLAVHAGSVVLDLQEVGTFPTVVRLTE